MVGPRRHEFEKEHKSVATILNLKFLFDGGGVCDNALHGKERCRFTVEPSLRYFSKNCIVSSNFIVQNKLQFLTENTLLIY